MDCYRFIAAMPSLLLCILAGCTSATLSSSRLPEGFSVRNVAEIDLNAEFVVNRAGSVAAMTEESIRVVNLSGGPGRNITAAPATALCFSPDGAQLAAAFAGKEQSVLRVLDLRGKVIAETILPGRVTAIAWHSERELLATALGITKYTFGSRLTSTLYRWNGSTDPVATSLGDVTVRPHVAKLSQETLFGSLTMAVSPYGDEIAYTSLKDPPLFTPYLRVTVRHLETGAEREIAKASLDSRGPIYAPDGESLLMGDRQALSRQISLPDGREIDAWPVPGDHAALSPAGSYVFLDGHLYQAGREIVSFPPESVGAFLPDGSGLAIVHEGTLYLVAGMRDTQRSVRPRDRKPLDLKWLLDLRRLRMLGLITDQEFKSRKERGPAR